MDYPILNMKYMNMHVRSDCIGWNDEFGMILAWFEYGMVSYKGNMELVWA